MTSTPDARISRTKVVVMETGSDSPRGECKLQLVNIPITSSKLRLGTLQPQRAVFMHCKEIQIKGTIWPRGTAAV